MTNQTETIILMDLIAGENSVPDRLAPRLVERARLNKVRLEALRRLGINDELRQSDESRLAAFRRTTVEVVSGLKNLDYALIKFFKPVAYVPSDLDLLVSRGDEYKVRRTLKQAGFEYVVSEPNCVTMRRDIQIDVYTNPDFMNVPYLVGDDLLKYSEAAYIGDVETRALAQDVEAVLLAAHSVYKEQLITLNDYFTLRKFLRPSSLGIGEALKVDKAIHYCLSVLKRIEDGSTEAPFKIPFPVYARIFLQKLGDDSKARREVKNLVRKLGEGRLASLAVSRLLRESY